MSASWVPNVNYAFQPVQNALATYRQGMDAETRRNDMLAQQKYQQQQDAANMAFRQSQAAENTSYRNKQLAMDEKRFKLDSERIGLQNEAMLDERGKRRLTQAAGIAQMIVQEQDPAKKQALYDRFIQTDKGLAGKVQGMDADSGAQWIIGLARGYQEPKGIAEQQKPPTGYQWTPQGTLSPIPGGPADAISGEQAARTGMLMEGINGLETVKKIALGSDDKGPELGWGPMSHANFQLERGNVGELRRQMSIGIEGILRALTGAAATQGEVDRLLGNFLPRPEDTIETRKKKLDAYEATIRRVLNISTKAQTGSAIMSELEALGIKGANSVAADPRANLKQKYGLE